MIRLSIVLIVLAAACGGSEKPAQQPTTNKMTASSADDNHAMCASFFQRERECTAQFIPTLVAARVAADKPAGIAAEDAKNGRDALIAKANEEWATDSTDAAIDAMCTKILEVPPSQDEIDQGTSCMASSDCQAFSDCAVALTSKHWQ
jgi:hypothetical protein